MDDLVTGTDGRRRCGWCGTDPDYVAYHDDEWGRPVHDERRLFEKLCLEGFQAGLSWLTILRRREGFRAAFAGFEPTTVAGFGDDDVEQLLADTRIIRHRGKIEAAIGNARRLVAMQEHGESLDDLVWSYAPPPRARPTTMAEVPASTPESTALSRELRRRGWRFVGPTTAYAFMQSMGLVDDHLTACEVAPEP